MTDLRAEKERLREALIATRCQWIHSVNAEQCMIALGLEAQWREIQASRVAHKPVFPRAFADGATMPLPAEQAELSRVNAAIDHVLDSQEIERLRKELAECRSHLTHVVASPNRLHIKAAADWLADWDGTRIDVGEESERIALLEASNVIDRTLRSISTPETNMTIDSLPKIQSLLAQGWDLTVTQHRDGKFHAVVHLGPLNGPDSQHWLGNSAGEAIAGLERYIGEREDAAAAPMVPAADPRALVAPVGLHKLRCAAFFGEPCDCGAHVPTPTDQWTPEQLAQFTDHTVQCRCGWWGKVGALKVLPNITRSDSTAAGSPGLGHWESITMTPSLKRGCPECGNEFTPVVNMIPPYEPGKPL